MPLRLYHLYQKLVLAALLVNVDAPPCQHLQAVARLVAQVAETAAVTDTGDLRVAILQCEVAMAARGDFAARNFAGDPDVGVSCVQQTADLGIDLGDGENAPLGEKRKGS